MKVLKENLVGLLKLLLILVRLLLPLKPKPVIQPRQQEHKPDKYNALIGPSEPHLAVEPLFCPKCKVLVTYLRRTSKGIQIIKNNKVLITMGGNVTIEAGGKVKTGFPLRCPNGHTVEVE